MDEITNEAIPVLATSEEALQAFSQQVLIQHIETVKEQVISIIGDDDLEEYKDRIFFIETQSEFPVLWTTTIVLDNNPVYRIKTILEETQVVINVYKLTEVSEEPTPDTNT